MKPADTLEMIQWLVSAGIEGTPETELLPALGERMVAAGIPLLRANIYQPTLHPMIGGHIFVWWRGEEAAREQSWDRMPVDPESRADPVVPSVVPNSSWVGTERTDDAS